MPKTIALLRKVLLLDAVTCVAAGLLMTLAAHALSEPLGLEVGLLRGAGLALLPFAVFLVHTARRARLSQAQVGVAIGLNLVWVIESVLLVVAGWAEPTVLGTVFVLGQAAAVMVLADLELLGVWRLRGAAAVPG